MPKYVLKKLSLTNEHNSLDILQLSIKANDELGKLNNLIASIPNYELLLQPLTVREAVASNEIENIRTTTFEMLQAELLNPLTLPSAQKEVLHYKKSLLLGLDIFNKNKKLELEDLINIHCGIVPDKIGIRTRPGVVIGNRLGEIIYTPPQDKELIEDYLENLFEYINHDHDNPLLKIIITHYQLEAIHPFYDGNGRVGRILMALQFCVENKLKYPILYSSGYITKNKATYYQLFRSIQESNNWSDWIIFHLNGIIMQSIETTYRVKEIIVLHKTFINKLNEILSIQKKSKTNVENYFFIKAFYTQSDMAKVTGISRNTAKKYLDKLLKENILEVRSAGKEQLYFIPEFLEILS